MSRKVGRTARETDELWRERLALRCAGVSVARIAVRMGVSRNLVNRVSAEIRQDDEQQARESGEEIPARTYWPEKRKVRQ
jgi:hypothetical protein